MYVLDASSIVLVPRVAIDSVAAFQFLTDEVVHERACFPDETLDEVGRLGRETESAIWVYAVKNSRSFKSAQYEHHRQAALRSPDLVDPDEYPASGRLQVLASALEWLTDTSQATTVVCDDFGPKPTRTSLSDACQGNSVPCITLRDYFAREAPSLALR